MTYLILLPRRPALFMTSLTQTARHKMAAPTVVFCRLSSVREATVWPFIIQRWTMGIFYVRRNPSAYYAIEGEVKTEKKSPQALTGPNGNVPYPSSTAGIRTHASCFHWINAVSAASALEPSWCHDPVPLVRQQTEVCIRTRGENGYYIRYQTH